MAQQTQVCHIANCVHVCVGLEMYLGLKMWHGHAEMKVGTGKEEERFFIFSKSVCSCLHQSTCLFAVCLFWQKRFACSRWPVLQLNRGIYTCMDASRMVRKNLPHTPPTQLLIENLFVWFPALNQVKVSFLMGFHSRLGAESAVYAHLQKNPLFDPLLLRILFAFLFTPSRFLRSMEQRQ